jgi:hypothetical protein
MQDTDRGVDERSDRNDRGGCGYQNRLSLVEATFMSIFEVLNQVIQPVPGFNKVLRKGSTLIRTRPYCIGRKRPGKKTVYSAPPNQEANERLRIPRLSLAAAAATDDPADAGRFFAQSRHLT